LNLKAMSINSKAKQVQRPKHIPQRTCVACRTGQSKRELVRVVVSETGVEVDPSGKKSGRGAYLCPNCECWELGLKGNRLEHALRTRLSMANRQILIAYGKTLSGRS
jgi:predicted RNA-binding protein YlxR (DUF448 family)